MKTITEELCGHAFRASAISAIDKRLGQSLTAFAGLPLTEPFPDLVLDARCETVREGRWHRQPGRDDRRRHRPGRPLATEVRAGG